MFVVFEFEAELSLPNIRALNRIRGTRVFEWEPYPNALTSVYVHEAADVAAIQALLQELVIGRPIRRRRSHRMPMMSALRETESYV